MLSRDRPEDRIRQLVSKARDFYAIDGGPLRMPGMFGVPMLGSMLPLSAMPTAMQPPTRDTTPATMTPAPEKAQYLQDMPYGLGPRPIRDAINQTPIAPMPSAMPRYEGDIMPMPDAVPAQKLQPKNPKPMRKTRTPFRMDAPPAGRRRG